MTQESAGNLSPILIRIIQNFASPSKSDKYTYVKQEGYFLFGDHFELDLSGNCRAVKTPKTNLKNFGVTNC